MSCNNLKVLVWNENIHDRENETVKELYPKGLHGTLAEVLAAPDLEINTATMEQPEHGLTQEVLDNTDVLVWWAHVGHEDVADEVVQRVQERVWAGMGLIVLHSGHRSKIFRWLNGTSGKLMWREVGEKERIWITDPAHPINQGLPPYFELEHEEMYGEPFRIAEDAKVILMSWFEGGEVFRSGFTLQRGNGKIFYFRPGHETHPTFYDKNVQTVIANGIRWAAPTVNLPYPATHRPEALEELSVTTA